MPLSISQRRVLLLIAATTVSLSSGTNYLFSAYAPQLGSQLHLSSTQLNLIGIAGNLGVYTSGPVWGVFIDRRGPRGVLLAAAGLVAAGYGGVRWIYLTHATAGKASSGTVWALAGCMLMTGYAASAGLGASINSVARSFPSSARATATGITLAGFGLSAFLFSSAAHVLFEGRTEAFLALLAVGTAVGMLVGVVGVRPIHYVEEGYVEDGYAPVEGDDAVEESPGVKALALTRSRSTEVLSVAAVDQQHELDTSKHLEEVQVVPVEVTGTALFRSLDFWIITAILALLSGTGLMYINNVGSVVRSLATADLEHNWKAGEVAKVQATQVSVISIWNCLGRISMGMLSDYAKTRYGINRVWFTLLIAAIFLASQLAAQMTTDLSALSQVSGLLGMAYGNLFALLPIVVLEWFGLANFSMNWGIVSLAPGLGGNVANLIFGRVYDSHVPVAEASRDLLRRAVSLLTRGGTISDPDDHSHDCHLGTECYATAFRITTIWCCIAFALGLFVALKHERKSRAERRRGLQKRKWSTVGEEDDET